MFGLGSCTHVRSEIAGRKLAAQLDTIAALNHMQFTAQRTRVMTADAEAGGVRECQENLGEESTYGLGF